MAILVTTAYCPSVSYMTEVIRADEIAIENFETYSKQTIRNHCNILGPNGRQTLSIPVIKPNGNHSMTKDVLISPHQPWQMIHWRSIETAYNNSPFFLYYQDYFTPFYHKKFKFLLDLNFQILQTLLQILKIGPQIRFTEKFEKLPVGITDLRPATGSKITAQHFNYPHYTQVFESRHGFIPELSIIDVIFNLGPESCSYLQSIK
jgi:hypothetical protein